MAKSFLDFSPADLGFSSKDNNDLGIVSTAAIDDLGFSADEQAALGIKTNQPEPAKIKTESPFKPSPADIKIDIPQPIAPGPYGEDIARQQAREKQNTEMYGEPMPHGKDVVVRPAPNCESIEK